MLPFDTLPELLQSVVVVFAITVAYTVAIVTCTLQYVYDTVADQLQSFTTKLILLSNDTDSTTFIGPTVVITFVFVAFFTINKLSQRLERFGPRIGASLTVNDQLEYRSLLSVIAVLTLFTTKVVTRIVQYALDWPTPANVFELVATTVLAKVTLPWTLQPNHYGFYFTVTAFAMMSVTLFWL